VSQEENNQVEAESKDNSVVDSLDNLVQSMKDKSIENSRKSLEQMVKTVVMEFEKTISKVRQEATDRYKILKPKKDDGTITEAEDNDLFDAISKLIGIRQLETNDLVFTYINKYKENGENIAQLTNPFFIKRLEQRIIHKCRTYKISKTNVLNTAKKIEEIKEPEFRKRLRTFLAITYLTLLNEPKMGQWRHFVMFHMGAIRIAIKANITFLHMEKVYSLLHDIPAREMVQIIPTAEEVVPDQPEEVASEVATENNNTES
jgi:hypothetical protein